MKSIVTTGIGTGNTF